MASSKRLNRMSSSVPDFKGIGEMDEADDQDKEMGLSPEEQELFKVRISMVLCHKTTFKIMK